MDIYVKVSGFNTMADVPSYIVRWTSSPTEGYSIHINVPEKPGESIDQLDNRVRERVARYMGL